MISLGKFVVAFILLSGLFIYDIFWVFGTEATGSTQWHFPQCRATAGRGSLGCQIRANF